MAEPGDPLSLSTAVAAILLVGENSCLAGLIAELFEVEFFEESWTRQDFHPFWNSFYRPRWIPPNTSRHDHPFSCDAPVQSGRDPVPYSNDVDQCGTADRAEDFFVSCDGLDNGPWNPRDP